MPVKIICDADGKTELTVEQAHRAGWGLVRLYCAEAAKDVDEFSEAMMLAAAEARILFLKRVKEAREKFRAKYPEGVLPDEEIAPLQAQEASDGPENPK